MVSTLVNIPGYRISEELYNGSRTLVYRGYREIDRVPVVIKLLKNPYPSFCELVQFRNQYTITMAMLVGVLKLRLPTWKFAIPNSSLPSSSKAVLSSQLMKRSSPWGVSLPPVLAVASLWL